MTLRAEIGGAEWKVVVKKSKCWWRQVGQNGRSWVVRWAGERGRMKMDVARWYSGEMENVLINEVLFFSLILANAHAHTQQKNLTKLLLPELDM